MGDLLEMLGRVDAVSFPAREDIPRAPGDVPSNSDTYGGILLLTQHDI